MTKLLIIAILLYLGHRLLSGRGLSPTAKTGLLMATIVALFTMIGAYVGGKGGMLLALIFGGGLNLGAYWFSDQLVLSLTGAHEISEQEDPGLFRLVRKLAGQAGLPMPKVYRIDEAAPNAFATGRSPEHGVVAVTRGIRELLSERELAGVIAHELAHIRHRDTLITAVAAALAGAISALANLALFFGGRDENGNRSLLIDLLVMLLAPLAASLIQMAISRGREYEADRAAAEICGDPEALASALEKLERHIERTRFQAAEEHPQTAAMMIVNPLSGEDIGALFSTHPPIAKRIEKLRAMTQRTVARLP